MMLSHPKRGRLRIELAPNVIAGLRPAERQTIARDLTLGLVFAVVLIGVGWAVLQVPTIEKRSERACAVSKPSTCREESARR